MGSPFVDREAELATLRDRYDRSEADCIVLYGRRRVGKSALVRESIRGRDDAVYWQATEDTPGVQLDSFAATAGELYPTIEDIQRDWEALLRALGRQDAIVILDEFPYLIESDDALPSKVQRVWDTDLEATGMTLVLVGSAISVREDTVLGGGSPLYGRRTAAIDLPPLSLQDATELYPWTDPDTIIKGWGVFGGTPYYLQALDDTASFEENVQSLLLSEHGLLHNEPEFLLRTDFGIREPQTYYSILRAIARGKREANEIATYVGLDSNALGTYLSKLRRLRIVERDVPVTATPTATRKSRYRLREPLFRFWFRYVYGQTGKLPQLDDEAFDQLVAPTFTDYMGSLFEIVCQEQLPTLVSKTYEGIGYWWHREHEVDVVGLTTDGTLVVGECKYTTRQMTEGDLAALERTADQIQWTPPDGGEPAYHYCCFARSGFSDDLQARAAARDDVSLFGPAEIVGENSSIGRRLR